MGRIVSPISNSPTFFRIFELRRTVDGTIRTSTVLSEATRSYDFTNRPEGTKPVDPKIIKQRETMSTTESQESPEMVEQTVVSEVVMKAVGDALPRQYDYESKPRQDALPARYNTVIPPHVDIAPENEPQVAGASNEHQTALRGAELFRQKSHESLLKHKLAAIHLTSRQFLFFTIPIALIAMVSGILAFVSTTDLLDNDEVAKSTLSIIVGSLSFVVVFLQTLSTQCKYGARAEMHHATTIDLRDLRENLANLISKSRVLMYHKEEGSSTTEDDGEDQTVEEIFDGIQKEYSQCLKSCKSTVPIQIDDAFHLMNSSLISTLSESGHRNLRNVYGSDYNNVLFFKAYNDLSSRFSCSRYWPLFLPNPTGAVDATMIKLKQSIAEKKDYWKELNVHTCADGGPRY